VVVLDPNLLDEHAQRHYYGLLEPPIKRALNSAVGQLQQTAEEIGGRPARVLLLINNGYTAVNHNEFKKIATKVARNATHKVDAVIAAGMYLYGDGFESYVICPFEMEPINVDRVFHGFDCLHEKWNQLCETLITAALHNPTSEEASKFPQVDLRYEQHGIVYIKPARILGYPSEFFTHGRPRSNSTGIELCPPVGVAFPFFDEQSWQQFRGRSKNFAFLRNSYSEWRRFATREEHRKRPVTRPLVPIMVSLEDCARWCREHGLPIDERSICQFAVEKFDYTLRELLEKAADVSRTTVLPSQYVFLRVEEIGQDMANDVSSLYMVRETHDTTFKEAIFENQRLFFEHALVLSCAYAVKHSVSTVIYERDQTYVWV
jgi:hypothetical protein